ncbi:sugar diacid recognition domain-containing protein [Brachyspira pilosicoli]|uniref:CdaR family transcriptional regulator n=1 Tax=Brachyspira pilosicoli TaxID=52584 RepID=UPI0012F49184|nr:sugar diacid recognition domain-containing protein [Brachyspira pilosicoli]
MSIDNNTAKKLVEKIMDNIDYEVNINIMNEYAEIIASGDKNRIGKIHSGALDVIKNAKTIEYFDSVDSDKESAKPGINMPLIFNNEVIGVVGVTGNPNEIKLIANMVKMITEILIENEIDFDKRISKQRALNNYVYKIISKEVIHNISSINIWAENNNYNFNIERCICIIKIEKKTNNNISKILDYIISKIQTVNYYYKQDIIAYIGNGLFLIIKSFNDTKNKNSDKNKILELFFNNLKKEININFAFMCGCIVNKLEDIHNSYEQANFLCEYINNYDGLYFIDDYILEYIILNEGYINSNIILKNKLALIKKNSSFKETIITMSKYDMNINKTCEELNMHRNTILYRIKKIKDILNLDPINKHTDRIIFYIIAAVLKR